MKPERGCIRIVQVNAKIIKNLYWKLKLIKVKMIKILGSLLYNKHWKNESICRANCKLYFHILLKKRYNPAV